MKNIFDDFDWDEYYRLMDVAHSSGVHVVHQNNIMGGFTFAWQRATDFPKSKMVVVAVSYCSVKDQFSRKIGTFNALNNFLNKDNTILLPVGDTDSAVIVERLREIFAKADEHIYW